MLPFRTTVGISELPDLAPSGLGGTACGLFTGTIGVSTVPASLRVRLLRDWYDARAPVPGRRGEQRGGPAAAISNLRSRTKGELRGTAFGVFNLVSGVALLVASVLAGLLWDRFGPAGTFAAGAISCLSSLVGFAYLGRGAGRQL